MITNNINNKKYSIAALSVLIFSLWVNVLLQHNVFEEWDGVLHYFSGKYFWSTYTYDGWPSHFWPPLQPLLISLGDPIVIGKSIAFISGLVCIFFCYQISRFNNVNKIDSLIVSIFLASSSIFILSFSVVENHAMESAFALIGLLFFLKSKGNNTYKFIVFSGAFIALAGLTRYTSYIFALIIGLFYLFDNLNKDVIKLNLKNFIIFSISFCLISLLWWVPNWKMNGSPLATWQYLNVGQNVHPDGALAWWWSNQDSFESLSEIVKNYPIQFIENFGINAIKGVYYTLTALASQKYLAILIILILIYSIVTSPRGFLAFIKSNRASIAIVIAYIAVCSVAMMFQQALLPIIVITTSLAGIIIIKSIKGGAYLLIALSTLNLIFSYGNSAEYLHFQKERGGQLTSLHEVNNILSLEQTEVIVSIHPARAYYSSAGWIMFPLYGITSMCDIINYNVSDKVFNYAPKYPIDITRSSLNISHLIVEDKLKERYPFIPKQMKNGIFRCSDFKIETIYNDDKNVSIYRVSRS